MLESPTSAESMARQSSADLEANLEVLRWREWSEGRDRGDDGFGLVMAAFWIGYGVIVGSLLTWVVMS
jgi:hypothetical protein